MYFKFIIFLLITNVVYCQNNEINIINCSSNYTNNIEYNTGEIFVVYDFVSNQTTSKDLSQNNVNTKEETSQIALYPNPTKDFLYYNLPDEISFKSVELYDQNQKLLFSSFENSKQISLEDFPIGIYYVIFNKNKNYNFKIIKR